MLWYFGTLQPMRKDIFLFRKWFPARFINDDAFLVRYMIGSALLWRCLLQSRFKFWVSNMSLVTSTMNYSPLNSSQLLMLLNCWLYHCYLEPVTRWFITLIWCFTRRSRLCLFYDSLYKFLNIIYGLLDTFSIFTVGIKIVNCKQ